MLRRVCVAAVLPLTLVFCGCEKSTVEGTAGKKLTLTKPSDVTIKQGQTDKVNVAVSRHNFSGPVRVKFNNLPAGVDVVDGTREIGDSATFVLQAKDNADLVKNHQATVTVEGPDGMKATEAFEITVKEKS